MANADTPHGLRPVRHVSGTKYDGAVNHYYVPATDAQALFVGDPIVKTGDANATEFMTFKPGTLPGCTRATAGATNPITGIVVGVMSETQDSKVYREASQAAVLLVADDPDLLFHIQDDGATALDGTAVSANANLIFTHDGNEMFGLSGCELDTSAVAPDATAQLTIQRLANVEGNDLGENAIWEVKINTQSEADNLEGV